MGRMESAPGYHFIQDRLGIDLQAQKAEVELAGLGVDSLTLLELMFEIEEKFGVKLEEDTPPPRTCGELAALIERVAGGT